MLMVVFCLEMQIKLHQVAFFLFVGLHPEMYPTENEILMSIEQKNVYCYSYNAYDH